MFRTLEARILEAKGFAPHPGPLTGGEKEPRAHPLPAWERAGVRGKSLRLQNPCLERAEHPWWFARSWGKIAAMAAAARGMVEELGRVAARYAAADRELKIQLLDRLADERLRSPRLLRLYHEAVCFLQAYPDDDAVLTRVDRALEGFAARVAALGRAARRLHDSGIDGTALDYPFGLPMARWLAARFPGRVDVLWRRFSDAERAQESLWLLLDPLEQDAFSDEAGLGWRRWLEVARGGRRVSALAALLERFEGASMGAPEREWLFESLGLPIAVRLAGPGGSRTRARVGPRPSLPARAPAPRRLGEAEFRREIDRPMPLRAAPPAEAEALIDGARLAMATRARELYAFSHANPADVLVGDAGGGLSIALIGILPAFRQGIEAYYAYLAIQHGVPVGYGAAWRLTGPLDLAVNVFETFRRGESAFIVSQAVRAYRRALGGDAVCIDPYQIGRDNREALQSGAFYFYSYLGFRPRDPAVAGIADGERAKILRDAAYRSPLPVLRALSGSAMVLPLTRRERTAHPRLTAAALGALVTRDTAAVAAASAARRSPPNRRATSRVTRAPRAAAVRRG